MKTGAKTTALTIIEDKSSVALEAVALELAVEMLEYTGGDLTEFTKRFDAPDHLVVFHLEKRLRDHHSPVLRERWEKALELFHLSRMRLLQRDAIRRLEDINPDEDKQARVELAYAKIILGDLLTGANIVARQRAANKTETSSTLAEAIAIMEGADDAELA